MIKETIDDYLRTNPKVVNLCPEQQISLRKIFVSLVQQSNPEDHLQLVGELMAFCSKTLRADSNSQKQIARIANKALEMMLAK